jgi:hypothetical protein
VGVSFPSHYISTIIRLHFSSIRQFYIWKGDRRVIEGLSKNDRTTINFCKELPCSCQDVAIKHPNSLDKEAFMMQFGRNPYLTSIGNNCLDSYKSPKGIHLGKVVPGMFINRK